MFLSGFFNYLFEVELANCYRTLLFVKSTRFCGLATSCELVNHVGILVMFLESTTGLKSVMAVSDVYYPTFLSRCNDLTVNAGDRQSKLSEFLAMGESNPLVSSDFTIFLFCFGILIGLLSSRWLVGLSYMVSSDSEFSSSGALASIGDSLSCLGSK